MHTFACQTTIVGCKSTTNTSARKNIVYLLWFIFSWCSLYSNSTIVCSLCAIYQLSKCYSITIPTMRRVFKALGVVTVDLGFTGKVAL